MAAANKSVLVVGGGAAGMQASLDLANMGFTVHLLERSPSLGEKIAYADQASPVGSSISPLYPKMVECARHPRIVLHTYSEVAGLEGSRKDFIVRVVENPRYVKADKCIGCQACADKCPSKVPNEVDSGKSTRKAIYMPFPESVPRIVLIDSANCLFFTKKICRVCERFCTSKAVDFDQKPRETELEVAAIIVAPTLDMKDSSVFPDSKNAGIYRCQYPTERGPGDLQTAAKLGAAIAKSVSQDMAVVLGDADANRVAVLRPKGITAVVDPAKCNACGACENLCASGAPKVTSSNGQKISQINPLRCEGCGTCVAGCPRFAITLDNYADDEILDKVNLALNDRAGNSAEPKILMFACNYCGLPITERTGAWKTDYPESVKIIELPCSGRLDPFIVAAALKAGADGVIISGCRPKYCHFLIGNRIAEQRYKILLEAMDSLDAGSGRVRLQWISPSEPKPFTAFVKELSEKLRVLGPNPVKTPRSKST
jgi:heterodisulfide reductase subunit A-like polyferredoxin/coenzyme F420-reducing hydrogenase delta subunit